MRDGYFSRKYSTLSLTCDLQFIVNYIVDAFVWSSFNLLFLEQIRKHGLKEGLKACFIVEGALSLSSWFTGTSLKYLETNNSNTT